MTFIKRFVVLLTLVAGSACGGNGGVTSPPSPQAPTIATANTVVYIGQTVAFSASGAGTIRWGGDAPAVASVDATTGAVTGITTGRVTIWAENSVGRTTRLLRVVPSFAGTWQGAWQVERCEQDGIFVTINSCSLNPPGESKFLMMRIAQSDDRITGDTMTFGSISAALPAATVGDDGTVRFAGALPPVSSSEIRIAVENFVLTSSTPGVIQGSLEHVWTVTTQPGTMRVSGRIAHLPRIAAEPTGQSRQPLPPTSGIEGLVRLISRGQQ